MSKKDFIALADMIRYHRVDTCKNYGPEKVQSHSFNTLAISALADFCASQNPRFKRDRWLAYIAGECGPNGGAVKA